MKMQIAFRSTGVSRYGYDVVMAVGVVEVGPEDPRDYDEKAQAFRFDFGLESGYPRAVTPVSEPRVLKRESVFCDEFQWSTLDDLLRSQIERAIPDEHLNADFVLRETELPVVREGGRVYAFSGVLHLTPGQKFADNHLLWFEPTTEGVGEEMAFVGRVGFERRPETGEIDMTTAMVGEAMSAYLRKPLWGFGFEAYGLPGTMTIKAYRALERYQQLVLSDNLNSFEEDELNVLRQSMREAGLDNIERDPSYRKFIKEMRRMHPEFSPNIPMTAEQIVARHSSARDLVLAIMSGADDPTSSVLAP